MLAITAAEDIIRVRRKAHGTADWVPAWRPADITDSGRAQLRAIGFTI